MLNQQEVLCGILIPILVSALVAALGAWRRWPFAMPLAAGAGFLAGYGWMTVPGFPPRDGSDWLFWLAISLALLGAVDVLAGTGWGWLLGVSAAAVALVVLRPLVPVSVEPATMWLTAAGVGLAGMALALVAELAQKRMGSLWAVAAFCVAMGGAGVVIFSSSIRSVGIYGIAAAAALGPVFVLGARMRAARSVAVFAAPLLAGFLVAGHFYAEPGVSWMNFYVLLASPALLLLGAFLPVRRNWARGLVGLMAVTIAVAAVSGPTALKAKKAVEVDPYVDVYK